jgi:UDP-N-acetylmuramoyl-tripeptide--D-alanyl-D-alanine ligase
MRHTLFPIRPALGAALCCLLICLVGVARAQEPAAAPARRLTLEQLDRSLELGRAHLLARQNDAGAFIYEYDFVARSSGMGDNPVRQAGALWGLVLIHQHHPTPETLRAIQKSLAFFEQNSVDLGDGRRIIAYPSDLVGKTNTIALVALSIMDLLEAEPNLPERAGYERRLNQYIAYLMSVRNERNRVGPRGTRMRRGTFQVHYDTTTGATRGANSSYSDGEILLTLVKAAKGFGHARLRPQILESAAAMYAEHFHEPLNDPRIGNADKGFYQWGTMAFAEIATSGWKGADVYGQRAIEMSLWMISQPNFTTPGGNNGYAHEGVAAAYRIAKLRGDEANMRRLRDAIEAGLYELTTWQVGGPIPNAYLQLNPTEDRKAIGGVMNAKDDPVLRIDTTQHQMHALILARKYLYEDEKPADAADAPKAE